MTGGVAFRRELRIFTEGRKTEVQYLRYWQRLNRSSVSLLIDDFHGGPLQLVQHAVLQLDQDRRDERRGRGRAPSETWCMFDMDEHPNVVQALDLARQNAVNVVVSNPCVEAWFLLHFVDQTAWIHRHEAQHAVARFISAGKALSPDDLDALASHYGEARERAMSLAGRHVGNGNSPGENPSSDVWKLVDSIRM